MSRVIKFRAWDSAKRRMVDGNWYVSFYGTPCQQIVASSDYLVGQQVTLMQFTGLLDKNGKEIYEEDIVNFVSNITPKLEPHKVFWDDYTAQFIWDEKAINFNKETAKRYEVIGNIYENSSLLTTQTNV